MKKYQFLSENFQFLEVKCSIYLNMRVFIMVRNIVLNVHSSRSSFCLTGTNCFLLD